MGVLQLPLPTPVTTSCWPAAWKTSEQNPVLTGRAEHSHLDCQSCLQERLVLKHSFKTHRDRALLYVFTHSNDRTDVLGASRSRFLLTYMGIYFYNLLNAAGLHERGGDPLLHGQADALRGLDADGRRAELQTATVSTSTASRTS